MRQAPPYVLVDLWAAWCGPCRMVSPALEQVATEMAGRIEPVTVDIDRSPQLRARFAIQAVPTLLILDRGKVVARTMPTRQSATDAWPAHMAVLARPAALCPGQPVISMRRGFAVCVLGMCTVSTPWASSALMCSASASAGRRIR
ncbi:thioredoxin domain-containing protein [Streptomyces sp. NPDC046866]|uniref:thioredoxin family protein n=1 Tax=Streptomyces sp. NPDC046866 TaxID=3154921 RepID=UPI003454044E